MDGSDRNFLNKEQKVLVGTGRFELPTPRTPSECSTRLSHVPTGKTGPASGEVNHSILHHSCSVSTGLDRSPPLLSIFPSCPFAYAQALPPRRRTESSSLPDQFDPPGREHAHPTCTSCDCADL